MRVYIGVIHRTRLLHMLLMCAFVLTGAGLRAQVSPSMDSPMTPNGLPEQAPARPSPQQNGQAGQAAAADDSQQEAPTLRVTTNIVNVFFNARDSDNQMVTTLTKDDCSVLENGKPRPIERFELVKDQPLTLGVLIDTSGSQEHLLPMEKESGYKFLREVVRPLKDEAFVISFDINVDLLGDYTNDLHRLKKALDEAEINTGSGSGDFIPGLAQQRGTLLYDAVYLASHDEFKSEGGRHAMVLLTDGQDEGSKVKLKEAVESAQRADASVYVILLYDPSKYRGMSYWGDHYVKQIVEATGGRVFEVGHDSRRLEATFDALNAALHSQYQLSFSPLNTDGKYHTLQIQCRGDKLKLDARKGFYATPAP